MLKRGHVLENPIVWLYVDDDAHDLEGVDHVGDELIVWLVVLVSVQFTSERRHSSFTSQNRFCHV
jgi:hypothetical protein